MAIVLASQSPRRRQLMELVAPAFEVDCARVNEALLQEQSPLRLALALAEEKAWEVARRRGADVIIGCDTVVEADGKTLGKPKDEEEAAAMLGMLQGRRHFVHTGVAVVLPAAQRPACFVESTAVDFAPICRQAIMAYVQTDEAYDKAGGYGIQGWAARYVTRVEGCYYNVMGLPVAALYSQLKRLGVLE